MSKLGRTATALATILVAVSGVAVEQRTTVKPAGRAATAQKTPAKPAGPAAQAQPSAEWRNRRAVPRNPAPVLSADAAVKKLGAKGDFSISVQTLGTAWRFLVNSKFQGQWHETRVQFKCKVKTEPSNLPGAWLVHDCQPPFVNITLGPYESFSVDVPEPAPDAPKPAQYQGSPKMTGFQIEATIDPDKKFLEWSETNNTASLTWE